MALSIGIVGLPNVGKSTLFNSLTKQNILAANYPFATIEPNQGIVPVPDERLQVLADIVHPGRIVPATVEFVDIAGLVAGASKGEGLGNQFLANIRECDAICEVVRYFDDPDIVRSECCTDPVSDFETIRTELVLADIATVEKAIPRLEKEAKREKELAAKLETVKRVSDWMNDGEPARTMEMTDEEREHLRDLHLMTMKPVMVIANVDEGQVTADLPEIGGIKPLPLCAKVESEIAELDEDDAAMFLEELGLEESGLSRLAKAAYTLLGLQSFFTAGEIEVKAWTVKIGAKAPQAAGVIHTDFERGFIKAETASYDDYVAYKGEAGCREHGRLRQEGKEYVVQDGDVMHFKFNVSK